MERAGEIAYAIERSARARRVRLKVDARSGVRVVLPCGVPERAAAEAVDRLRPWIERRLAEADMIRALVAARGAQVPYLGRPLAIVAEPGRRRVARQQDRLLVPEAGGHAALERWFRRAARTEIAPRLDAACSSVGAAHAGLTIRGQRTRWASCAASGRMSFNWRLLLAPEPILDYVVWHEVCHLEVMDHSPRFWSLLARRWPAYREHAGWLRRYGATLVLPALDP